MSLTYPLHGTPLYTGGSVTNEVPGRFDIAIGGRPYMLDASEGSVFSRRPIQMLRNQADTGDNPGEQSLSPEELWRRSQDSWDHGAGQVWLDRADSDNRRFRSSKGVDVWEKWALQLLPDTTQKLASANTNLLLAVAGSRLYVLDGTALRYTTDLTGTPTWTPVTGLVGTATSIATDGYNVFTAQGSDGVFRTTNATGSSAKLNDLAATVVGYAKGRLMAAVGSGVYNITDYGVTTAPTVLYAHPNTDWRWVGFAEGQTAILAAGYSGDKSAVYRITIKPDGTGLDQPTVAFRAPDGEVITAIDTYVSGVVVIGTTRGVRFGIEGGDGGLSVGPVIPTGSAVYAFEPQDRFVWFGWSNYDASSTGLGRLDPSTFPSNASALTPAYASDLMVTGQGVVTSIVTFGNRRVFGVAGLGVYREATNKVAIGTLDTGLITFGIPDDKVAMYLDVKVREAVDTNRAYVSVDGGTFVEVGSRSTTSVDPFPVGEKVGATFEVRHELINADVDPTAGPVVTRYTLRAYPNPRQGEIITLAVLLRDAVLTRGDDMHALQPAEEYAYLRLLQQARQLVRLQIGGESLTVLVDDHQFNAENPSSSGGWQGTCVLKLKALAT